MIGTITSILLLRFVVPILSLYHEPSMAVISYPNGSHPGSLLGFSMAYLNKHLVIGAPKHTLGKLFDYDIWKNGDLKEILSPFGEDNYNDSYWLGAVIKTGSSFLVLLPAIDPANVVLSHKLLLGEGERQIKLLATTCAPRSFIYWNSANFITRGTCYTMRDNTLMEMKDIPINLIYKYSNSGIDTSGWSIEIDPEDKVFIGSPALSVGGSIKIYENITHHPIVLGNSTNTLNFGYSITSGYFLSENEISYAIGSNYGLNGEGMIFILNKLNKEEQRLYENEVGSSYGSVLCKVHLTGKKSSLLVGAPSFSENSKTYDNGAVYLYVAKNVTKEMTLKRIIKGQKCGGYFGFAIISLGDMDGDEKDEVAIAAPYEDDMKGAVYIYSGFGLLSGATWLQRIQAQKYKSFGLSLLSLDNCFENGCNEVAIAAPYEDDMKGAVYIYSGFGLLSGATWLQRIQAQKYKSFGLSLLSLDNCFENGCNELAVGAPYSERVFILKCNNYITLNISAVFPNLQIRTNKTLFSFTTCIKVDLPKNNKTLNSKIRVRVELMHPDASLEKKDGIFIFTLDSRTDYCNNVTVLTPTNGNYDALIAYKISASLNDESSVEYSSSRVLLSDRSNLQIQGELWAANCESSTGKCMPKLTATLLSNIPEPYIVGSGNVSFSLSVLNDGDTSYVACVLVLVLGAHVLRNPPLCTRHDGNEQLMCKSPTPIHTHGIWELGEMQIDTNLLTSSDESITVQYITYDHCNNDNEKQEYERVFYLDYDKTNIVVTGVSNPSDLVNLTSADLAILQPFEHFYMITNNGSTHWVDVRCEVLLEKREYVKYKVYIAKWRTEPCVIMEGETNITSICDIGDLQYNELVHVIISAEVLPNSLSDIIWKQNVTITTQLAVLLRENRKIQSVTTILTLQLKSVPVWIPVVASLVALLIIFIIIIILHKKKYFHRKNKKELDDLKAIHGINSTNQQEG